jgi:hypothetical protein
MPHINAVGITGKKKTQRSMMVQKKHTIREFIFSSPLDLNVISRLQVIQTIRDMKSMWRSINWWCSYPIPLYSFLCCPPPVGGVSATKHPFQFQSSDVQMSLTHVNSILTSITFTC